METNPSPSPPDGSPSSARRDSSPSIPGSSSPPPPPPFRHSSSTVGSPHSMANLVQTVANTSTKMDDITQILNTYAIFTYHGKVKRYAKSSLYCLSSRSPLRKLAVWLINSPWFQRWILVCILTNSAILGIADFQYIDIKGNLLPQYSYRNYILLQSEPIFTAIFATEAVLKIIAMGFLFAPGSYLRDGWNILDFVIVSLALLANIPDMPNYTGLRVARVLRPLRSLTALPSLRSVIAALLRALPSLVNVLILLIFCYTVFGIFCLQLYSGTMHGRCRLTEFPVQMNPAVSTFYNTTTNSSFFDPLGSCTDTNSWDCFTSIANLSAFSDANVAYSSYYSGSLNMRVHKWVNDTKLVPCIPGLSSNDMMTERSFVSTQFEYDNGKWREPQACWWPLDPQDRRLCSLTYWGAHQCPPGRFCGSNYDSVGRSRFSDKLVMWGDLYIPELNWGMTVFDNTFFSFLSIFQMTTLEGWSLLLYMVQAGNDPIFAALLFSFIVLLMAYFGLNLTLAVLWDSFKKSTEAERLAAEQQQRLLAALKAETMRVEIERLRALREAVEKEHNEQRRQRSLRRRERQLEKERKRLLALEAGTNDNGFLTNGAKNEGKNTHGSPSKFGSTLTKRKDTPPEDNESTDEEDTTSTDEDTNDNSNNHRTIKPLDQVTRHGRRIARLAKQLGNHVVDGVVDMTTELKSVHTKLASDVLTVTQKVTTLAEKTATSTTDAFRRVVEDPTDQLPLTRLRSFAVTNTENNGNGMLRTSSNISNGDSVDNHRKEDKKVDDGGSGIFLPITEADETVIGKDDGDDDNGGKETTNTSVIAPPLSEPTTTEFIPPHLVPELPPPSVPLTSVTTTDPNQMNQTIFSSSTPHKQVTTPIRHHSTVLVPGSTPTDIAHLVQFAPSESLEIPRLQLSRASSLRVLATVDQQNHYDHVQHMKTVIENDTSDDDEEKEENDSNADKSPEGNPSVVKNVPTSTNLASLEAELQLECAKAAAIGIDVTEAKQVENRLKDASLGTFGIKQVNTVDEEDNDNENKAVTAALATVIEAQKLEEEENKLRKRQRKQQERLNHLSNNPSNSISSDTFTTRTKRRISAIFMPNSLPTDETFPPTATAPTSTTFSSPDPRQPSHTVTVTANAVPSHELAVEKSTDTMRPSFMNASTTDTIVIPITAKNDAGTVHPSPFLPDSIHTPESSSSTAAILSSPSSVVDKVRNRIALLYPTVYQPSAIFLRDYLLYRPVSTTERIIQYIRNYLRQPHKRTYVGTLGHRLVTSRFWNSVITSLIIGNTIILCLDQYPNDSTLQNNLEIANLIFLCSFTFDILCKFFAEGWIGFFRDNWNTFDFFVIGSSIIELLVDPPPVFRTWTAEVGLPAIWTTASNSNLDKVNSTSLTLITLIDPVYLQGTVLSIQTASNGTTALRTFRLFRVFRLARSWTALNVLLRTTLRSIKDAANFAILLAVFVYVFSLVGMQIFANRFCFDPESGLPTADSENQLPDCDGKKPRARFDSLYFASLTVFQIFTLENWNVVLDDAWRAIGWTSSFYFVILILIGQYIVLDLFEAVLLSNFEKISELVVTDQIVRRKALELLTSQVTFGKKGLQMFKKGLEAIPLDQLKDALANGPEGIQNIKTQLNSTTKNMAKLLAHSQKGISNPFTKDKRSVKDDRTVVQVAPLHVLTPPPSYLVTPMEKNEPVLTITLPQDRKHDANSTVMENQSSTGTAPTRSTLSWIPEQLRNFGSKRSAKIVPYDDPTDDKQRRNRSSSISDTVTSDTPRSIRSVTSITTTTTPISYALDHQNNDTNGTGTEFKIDRNQELAKLPGMKKHISFEMKAQFVDRDELGSIYSYDSTNLLRTLTNHSEILTSETNEFDDTVDENDEGNERSTPVPVQATNAASSAKDNERNEIIQAIEANKGIDRTTKDSSNGNATVPSTKDNALPSVEQLTMDDIKRSTVNASTLVEPKEEEEVPKEFHLPPIDTTHNENMASITNLSSTRSNKPVPLTLRTPSVSEPASSPTLLNSTTTTGRSTRQLFGTIGIPSAVLSGLNTIGYSSSASRTLFSDDDITDIPFLSASRSNVSRPSLTSSPRRTGPRSLNPPFSLPSSTSNTSLHGPVPTEAFPLSKVPPNVNVLSSSSPTAEPLSVVPSAPVSSMNNNDTGLDDRNHQTTAKNAPADEVDSAPSSSPLPSPPVPPRFLVGRSLYLFTDRSYLRIYCKYLIDYPLFDMFIMLCIILSSILLALDNPLLPPDHVIVLTTYYVDILVTTLFALESTARIIVNGLAFNGKRSYLRSPWNIVDAIVVVSNILSLVFRDSSVPSLRTLRALRATRPLRIIRALPGLRLIVNSIAASLPGIFNVLFVVVLSLLIFAVIAVGNLKGALWSCQGDRYNTFPTFVQNLVIYPPIVGELSYEQKNYLAAHNITYGPTVMIASPNSTAPHGHTNGSSSTSSLHQLLVWSIVRPTSKSVCLLLGGSWEHVLPGTAHFDNVWCGLLTLLTMTTTEGWVDVLHALTDQRGVEMQPIPDSSVYWSVYAILVMIIGSFFIMKMFVGVVLDNYNIMRERLGGNAFLTADQRLFIKTQKMLIRIRPFRRIGYDGSSPLRVLCWKIASNRYFELLITISILTNTVTMALPYFGQSWSYGNSITISNLFFNCVFTFEALLKIIALQYVYLTDNWNRFDFFIMIGTNIGIILEAGFGYTVGVVAMAIRAVRLTRILRLFNRENALIKIYTTFILGLPSLINTGSLLSLILYVYAIIGMELFATVQWGGGGMYGYGGSTGITQGLTREANFQSFPLAFLTLFRCFTGESWHMIMSDAADNPGNCVHDFSTVPWETKQNLCGYRSYNDFYNPVTRSYDKCAPINGCGSSYAYPFFVTYIFIVYYIFVNLLVAVILEGFAESEADESARLSDKHFQQLAFVWSRFDPKAKLFLDANDLPMVIQQLDEPMGFGKAHIATVYQLRKRVAKLKIPVYQGSFVHFVDVAAALARRVFIDDARKLHQKDFHIPENYETKLIRKKLPTYTLDRSGYHVGHVYAARLIQFAWRSLTKRRKFREQKHQRNL